MNLYAILQIIDGELIALDFQIANNLAEERRLLTEEKFHAASRVAAHREGLIEGRGIIEDIRREIANSAPAESAGARPPYAGGIGRAQ